MRKYIMKTFLALSMALGCAVFPIHANASENVILPVRVSSTDLSDVMNMKVINESGKSVKLIDLVSKNKLTMLNFWGTFCGPCTKEMPVLEKFSKKYADKGFGVIGLCVDVVDSKGKFDEEEHETAKDIVATTGVTYPIVYPMPKMKETLNLVTFPTTYFVDSKGKVLQDGIFGARDEATWEKEIKNNLEKVK